ncbi:MAG: hypothetical protein ACO1O6_00915 [Bacteroidota bacterium]
MKKILFFLPLVFLLHACPMGLDYAMSEPGSEPVNQKLIGTWISDNPGGEITKIEFIKDRPNSLKAKVIERGEMYSLETDNLEVWQTVLNGKTFLILKPEGEAKFYHYQYELKDDEIVFHDVSLLDGGVDAVNSSQSLREQVSRSMSMEKWGEEKSTLKRVK